MHKTPVVSIIAAGIIASGRSRPRIAPDVP